MFDIETYQQCLQSLSKDEQEQLSHLNNQSIKNNSHFLCYVVYGNNDIYYEGIKLSVLSFFNQIDKDKRPMVVILSQRPDYFKTWQDNQAFTLINLNLSDELLKSCTQDDYYYRLKTVGLAYIIDILTHYHIANHDSKFLFFDSDTYFLNNPLPLYQMIDDKTVVMYKQEPKIFRHKKYRNYVYGEADKNGVTGLKDKSLNYLSPIHQQQRFYQLQENTSMFSSLIMGVKSNSVSYLLESAELMYPVRALTNARTVEQFCFAEIFKQHFNIAIGKNYVRHFSRRRQKAYVEQQMKDFWQHYPDDDFNRQLLGIQSIQFERPLWLVLAQAIKRIFKPEPIK